MQRISDSKTYYTIYRTEIYPANSVVQPSNNQGLVSVTDTFMCWYVYVAKLWATVKSPLTQSTIGNPKEIQRVNSNLYSTGTGMN